jgi:hypothetical protein
VKHGVYSTYVNKGCRCSQCRAANAAYHRDHRRGAYLRMVRGEVSPEHGHYATYINFMCRCDECRAAKRAYRKRAALTPQAVQA